MTVENQCYLTQVYFLKRARKMVHTCSLKIMHRTESSVGSVKLGITEYCVCRSIVSYCTEYSYVCTYDT